jgi:hypothetical protein
MQVEDVYSTVSIYSSRAGYSSANIFDQDCACLPNLSIAPQYLDFIPHALEGAAGQPAPEGVK